MAKRTHIFLGSELAETIDFSLNQTGYSKPVRECNVAEQAAKMRTAYNSAIEQAKSEISRRIEKGLPVAKGYYLDVNIDKDSPMPYAQLDASNKGPRLMQVKLDKDDNGKIKAQSATVYLPNNHEDWLTGKIDKYETQKTISNQPKNKPLINAMDGIEIAAVRQLFPQPAEYDELLPNVDYQFEIWIDNTSDDALRDLFNDIDRMGLTFERDNILKFDLVTIILVKGTKETLDDIPFALNDIEAVRRYYNPADMVSSNEENREWGKLVDGNIVANLDENSPRISIIDRGINRKHPLLKKYLPKNKCKSVIDNQPLFFEGTHGTGMAGLSLFGDLAEQLRNTGKLEVNHDLSSVKLQNPKNPNPPKLWGKLTIDAINESDAMGAKINCMAMTEDKEYANGTPTSWSAAIDEALYNGGECDRLMVLSTGNTKPEDIRHGHYIDDINGKAIQTPCEALNAIVVGAYTQKVQCQRKGYMPEAPINGISPFSRTSMLWRGNNAKPDIVMEGGNLGYHAVLEDSVMPELSLITTSSDISQEPLQYFNATSASSALAARLAARIKYANPQLSMLSVRALMIHSAEWTDEMRNIDHRNSVVMAYCGYGVPNERAAIASDDTSATFIFENELIPYQVGKDSNVYNEMHFYDLPWPKDLLIGMSAEDVRLKVTLSYYIQPSPTQKGNYNKYRYQSAGLAFDVKTVNESREQFIARHNSNHPVEDKSNNDTDRWMIGQQLRSVGTVQSDWFECSAADLATCNEIAVYPTSGWWKYRKLDNVDNRIKYSLVVSITSSETPVYDAVANAIRQQVQVMV